jgi:hypothetical protein
VSTFGKRQGGGRRSADREHLPLIAIFTTRTRSHAAGLVDLSVTGARLRGTELPAADEDLILNIEGLSAYAVVKWSRLGFCGVEFDVPLSAPEITSLEQRVRAARGLAPELMAAMEDWTLGLAR